MASADKYEQEDLQAALQVLRRGGVILYPTDTVWGIGCDATNSAAVKRIYELKQRADSKAMLVLVDSADRLRRFADVPEAAETLLDATAEGRPMTIIYPHVCGVAPELVAQDGSIGIRITREPFSNALCARLGKPLVSTSANISGEPAAAMFAEINPAVLDSVDYVCRFRRNDRSPKQPSAIVKINADNTFQIIRS